MKYAEGFFYVAATQKCITKEGKDYSADNKILLDVSNTLLSVVFCTKSTAAFLLIAFWSHTGTQIGIKKAFVTSRESKLCSIWAIISVCLYPLLQYSFVSNKLLSTIAPQFLYHFETLMIAILSTVVHLRLRRSIQESAYGFSGVAILKHHMRCNIYLIFWNIVDLIGIASINVDALTTKSFNSNKIWLDICIKLYSTGSTGVFLVMMQILYPEGINPTGNSTRVSHQTPQTNAVKGASALKLQSSVELSKSNPDLHKSGV
ncbi:hypothetical protein BKA69DRAFT_1124532 [Paraphysoderma sedebokerense]|nr:hypothetical protein BKA69DRAFT_1124532 [Paraphysoderma sedebokerense]